MKRTETFLQTYLSIVGSEHEGSISAGVDRSWDQLLLLFDPNTGALERRNTQK